MVLQAPLDDCQFSTAVLVQRSTTDSVPPGEWQLIQTAWGCRRCLHLRLEGWRRAYLSTSTASWLTWGAVILGS